MLLCLKISKIKFECDSIPGIMRSFNKLIDLNGGGGGGSRTHARGGGYLTYLEKGIKGGRTLGFKLRDVICRDSQIEY